MPREFAIVDSAACSLEECVEGLREAAFLPDDEDSLHHAAGLLRRLGNNRDFLCDLLVGQLAGRHRQDPLEEAYGPQVVMLAPPGRGDFFLRANFWPSAEERAIDAGGSASPVYGLAHDHNFHFLTLGYFGPGYWSDCYEYDYESVAGCIGEPVDLRFSERSRLSEGRILHYRAHRDVHVQTPPDALSVSINVMHTGAAQGWLDQYRFDLDARTIAGIISHGASEAFLRVAVGLGGEEALDLAERFGRTHPSDRMRLAAWDALASVAGVPDAVWRRAENAGSRLVAMAARMRRASPRP